MACALKQITKLLSTPSARSLTRISPTSISPSTTLFSSAFLPLPATSRATFSTTTTRLSAPEAWKLGRLNHIAIVVPDLAKSTAMYRDMLGAEVSEPEDLPEHGVTVVFVNLGNAKLELLHPLSPESPVANFLKKNQSGGMHHVCIEVDEVEKAMEDLKKKNVRLLSSEPKIGAHGNPVVFLHPKDCNGVLTELEEVK